MKLSRSIFAILAIAIIVGGFLVWRLNQKDSLPGFVEVSPGALPFSLPKDFAIDIVARDLINPRVIAFDSQGRVFVSETSAGRVTLVEPRRTILEGLDQPHGVAFYENYLYVATVREVARYPYDVATATVDVAQKKNIADLPAGDLHSTRTIGFGKNFRAQSIINNRDFNTLAPEKLYISVGSSCDACLESTWKYGAILESDPDGTFTAEVAGGLRNSVFFTFHPKTGELWATEMGRDGLGDDLPPDEINIIKVGAKYGWPYCYGYQVRDETFTEESDRSDLTMDCSKTLPPIISLPAHVAPLGIAFVPDSWPKPWRGRLLVAYHGSLNLSEPVGYRIDWFDVDEHGRSKDAGVLMDGFLKDSDHIYGRPVDLKFGPDGSLYISDDTAGVIYKVVTQASSQ